MTLMTQVKDQTHHRPDKHAGGNHAAPRTLPQGRVLAIGVVPVAVVLAVMLGLYMASAAPAD